MTRRNSLPMSLEDVAKHNAKVRAQRFVFSPSSSALVEELKRYKYSAPAPVEKGIGSGSIADVDAELRSLGVPMHLLPAPKPPRMNKLEAEWAMILEARKRAGEILWYGFEAIKLRLADNTHYTPDFAVLDREGKLVFNETKGFWREDARVKIKVAAEMFPFFTFYAIQKKRKKDGGGWDIEGF